MPAVEGLVNFNPDKELPSLEGKIIFITGGTAGLGRNSILKLAKQSPAHIYFSGRNASAGSTLISEVQKEYPDVLLTFVEVDLSSLASVKTAATSVAKTLDRLDILMCNAGIMATPPGLSKDGFEIQFAVNHLGHAMLINVLLPVLERTTNLPGTDVRLIILTSVGYRGHPKGGVAYDKVRTTQDTIFGSWTRYGQSKLANIAYASELARRYPDILTVSVHPGVVETGLVTDLTFWKRSFVYVANFMLGVSLMDPEKGCYSQVWTVTGTTRDKMQNGGFYMPIGVLATEKLCKTARSEKAGGELWTWTQEVLAKV
ncbi:oxidoreductase [Lipomyces tetrasporus]